MTAPNTNNVAFGPGPQTGWVLNDDHPDAIAINAAGQRLVTADAGWDKAKFLEECGVTPMPTPDAASTPESTAPKAATPVAQAETSPSADQTVKTRPADPGTLSAHIASLPDGSKVEVNVQSATVAHPGDGAIGREPGSARLTADEPLAQLPVGTVVKVQDQGKLTAVVPVPGGVEHVFAEIGEGIHHLVDRLKAFLAARGL